MINTVTIKEIRKNDVLAGFSIKGHADYSKKDDIVCTAVSVLTVNTINSLVEVTKADFDTCICDTGNSIFEVSNPKKEDVILLASAKLGFMDLADRYCNYVEYFE